MLCERCGNAPASSRVTEIVDGAFQELSLCQDCARPLRLREEEDLLRCGKCGTPFDETELRRRISSVEVGTKGLTPELWNELQALAVCPICGEGFGLGQIPLEFLQDPSIQIEVALLVRLRPPSGGPETFQ